MVILTKQSIKIADWSDKRVLGLAGTVKYSFKPFIGDHSRYIAYLVNTFLIIYMIGSGSIYFVFAAQTMDQVTNMYYKDVRIWIGILVIPIAIFSALSTSNTIYILSTASNVFSFSGLIGTMMYIVPHVKNPLIYPAVENLSNLPSSLSLIIFAFEGTSTLLPVMNITKRNVNYKTVIISSMSICLTSYFIVGLCGFLAFGNDVKGSITLNLPVSLGYNTVKLLYGLGVVLTIAILMYVNVTIIISPLKKRFNISDTNSQMIEISLKIVMTLLSAGFAVVVPQLDNIMSLIGALGSTTVSLIIPPLLGILAFFRERDGSQKFRLILLVKDCILIIVGFFLFLIGMYTSIYDIIVSYKSYYQ